MTGRLTGFGCWPYLMLVPLAFITYFNLFTFCFGALAFLSFYMSYSVQLTGWLAAS